MEQIRGQNKKLKELEQSCEEELQKLKEVGRTHQAQIDTLLKFNQRLLGIIQNQFNTATKNKISSELQIISEINQNQNMESNYGNKLINKFISQNKGKEQSIDEYEDDDEEEEIYNQEIRIKETKAVEVPKSNKLLDLPKLAKLDRVFELQNKDEEVSINQSNSFKNSFPVSSGNYENIIKNPTQDNQKSAIRKTDDFQTQLLQLNEMIKQYKEQFVNNSAQYGQICEIIKNDLLDDLKEFKKIQKQSKQIYEDKVKDITKLRTQIKKFKPTNELIRVMKKLKVPAQTEKLLYRKIINKQG